MAFVLQPSLTSIPVTTKELRMHRFSVVTLLSIGLFVGTGCASNEGADDTQSASDDGVATGSQELVSGACSTQDLYAANLKCYQASPKTRAATCFASGTNVTYTCKVLSTSAKVESTLPPTGTTGSSLPQAERRTKSSPRYGSNGGYVCCMVYTTNGSGCFTQISADICTWAAANNM